MMENPKIRTFVEALEAEGFILRCLWTAKTGSRKMKYDDVGLYGVVGIKGVAPAEATLIIQDYGERDGFGLWFQSKTNRIEEDVRTIIGRMATLDELVTEEQRRTSLDDMLVEAGKEQLDKHPPKPA